ncbi:MAG TPA: tRNA (adenosine(37)-N6)-threonylcarbamoyltransferase complex dimerization subunit type 1 TsaB [Alphaproteobacteria bacterium]|jgi:tRNA threonylcarbamoyladenosine biosynthesis protein TsaB
MMTVLGIDTSAAACSAALWRGGAAVATERTLMARGHAEALMPMIERVMQGAAYGELDAVAVTAGPGAFTGLRIGLATARGIALAAGIPAIGVSVFAAIAAGIPAAARRGRAVAVAIDTKRGDVYLQGFDATLAPLGPGRVVAAAEIAAALPPGPLYVAGDGTGLIEAALAGAAGERRRDAVFAAERAPPDAATVAALGAQLLEAARRAGAPLPPPEPLYLRAPEATPLALQGKRRGKAR